VVVRYISFQSYRPSNVLDGNFMLAYLVSNHAEKMNRIDVIRLDRQNLPIDLLGGLQPTGLMMLDRNRQRISNRCCNGLECHGRNTLALFWLVRAPAEVKEAPRLQSTNLECNSLIVKESEMQ
jgi:hypothetical protein